MRYDAERGIYPNCRFCQGRGCLACPAEAEKAYQAAFPNGPQPLATFKIGDEPGALGNLLHALVGPAALEDARATARERAGLLVSGDAGCFVLGLLGSVAGRAVSAEEVQLHVSEAMVSEVLAENIVAKANQLQLSQGDLFAEPVMPAGPVAPARKRRAKPKVKE